MRMVNTGGPIALGVLGAIMYFAMADMIPGFDTKMVGLILMVAALLWLVFGFVAARPRSSVTTERTSAHGTGTGAVEGGRAAPQDRVVEREVRHDEI